MENYFLTKSNLKYKIVWFVLIAFVVSCDGRMASHHKKLEFALNASGENCPELEKVLSHYSQNPKDSLKLKAAEFLISNMTYHRSLCGEYIEKHIKLTDSLYEDMPLSYRAMLYAIPSEIVSLQSVVETQLDIENIRADFLIKNIEYSFNVWEKSSLYEPRISFEDFCEYILPYKFKNEPLILWKDSCLPSYDKYRDLNLYELGMNVIDSYYFGDNSTNYYSVNDRRFGDKKINLAIKDIENILYKDLSFNRSLGIPVAIDFIPYVGEINSRQGCWISKIYNKYLNSNLTSSKKEISAKVFRKTYSINEIPRDEDNFVPEFFKNPYNKDITNTYQNTSVVEYDFGNVPSTVKYAYLAVFNDGEWSEIAWSELKNGKASFANMGRDIIYMPLYYNKSDKICAKNAIFVDRNGEIAEIGIVDLPRQTIALERISPYNISGEYKSREIVGAEIIACNTPDNLKFDTLATITHSKYNGFDTLNVNSDKKYKYWFITPKKYSSFSEVQFFDKNGEQVQGQTVWLDRGNKILNPTSVRSEIFDNDVLTSFPISGAVGQLLDKPTAVAYVKYMPGNDQCGIIPGNGYELYFLNNGEWVSLIKKTATDYQIEFEDVPVNALLWVHDYGKKCYERPFTVNNGKIRFW